jgi:hypothetical protein
MIPATALTLLLCLVPSQVATTAPATTSTEPPAVTEHKLIVTPAAPPDKALKYLLLPDLLEQTPGNAALVYLQLAVTEIEPTADEAAEAWLHKPLEELRGVELPQSLRQEYLLEELARAARMTQCDWQRPMEQGIAIQLPDLGRYRKMARLLAAHIRLNTANGRYEPAIHQLKNGFALARHLGKGPTLLEPLVGFSITAMLLERVEELAQQPGAPNLYWALTQMPDPFIDVRPSLGYERMCLYLWYPRLRQDQRASLTDADWSTIIQDVDAARDFKMQWALVSMTYYPRAKQYVASLGYSTEQVQAMSVTKVVAWYMLDQYEKQRDDLFKWVGMPYWQAKPGLDAAERELEQKMARGEGMPFIRLLPALTLAYRTQARVQQRLACLRGVQAIRAYAAQHGQLPPSLDALTQWPAPLDPMTGQSFLYELKDGQAILDSPLPAADRNQADRLPYIIELAQ